ncbi:MAG: beta-ketoacyl-ACP synthase 3 [Gammaproteobacteria bacterium]|nr:MAG: beta-ketoacyl-ACP synthase 3 [Gammaproteobacteria bacterium]UTW43078.1 beta-ketoacyl-ACP synthase 3 [bacterium SCSIO 12844]
MDDNLMTEEMSTPIKDQQRINTLLNIYRYMLLSREGDHMEAELVNSGEANFLASSKGHEGAAILAPMFQPQDYLHCHYRDKALMLARGLSSEMFFLSALCKANAHSHGRQMVSHMSAPELNIMSIVGPVGNSALQAAGVAHVLKEKDKKAVVLCAIGDGTTQQGEVTEAIAEAKRSQLPVLFFIHDNGLAISTRTEGKTFFSLPDHAQASQYYDIPITYLDGSKALEHYDELKNIVDDIRANQQPGIVVFKVNRLDNHSNADNQKLYRSNDEISGSFDDDPLIHAKSYLISLGVEPEILDQMAVEVKNEVQNAVNKARQDDEPEATFTAERPLSEELKPSAAEYRGDFTSIDRLSMLEAMRETFKHHLLTNENVCLLGEDIEDGKGDVFGITRGLSTQFPGRVINTALSESTITGLASGMALAGKQPVAFIQFADFMPLAYNQIFTELGTMYWRSHGQWENPVIVFAACGGYRPGLGPFHSQTNEATYAHIPGIDVYMPSNASDAVGMLNAAFKSKRPCVFLYPKKLLNNASIEDTTSHDVDKQLVPIGKARIVQPGNDITLVGWGNTVSLCQEVAAALSEVNITAEVIDLRTVKPIDKETLLASAEKTKRLIVTHEDNHSCGVGAEVIASVIENSNEVIRARRITRADTYTPCNYANQLEVLPSFETILTTACDLLDLNIQWQIDQQDEAGYFTVEVIGASPSDESVLISEIHIKEGDEIKASDKIVDIEASKSAGEILSPHQGVVEQIYVNESETALVGSPLIRIKLAEGSKGQSQIVKKHAIITKKATEVASKTELLAHSQQSLNLLVGISKPVYRTGSRQVLNGELLKHFPNHSHQDIVDRTGIENRYWLKDGESVVDLAYEATIEIFNQHQLKLSDIDLILCATCTPEVYQSPAVATQVLEKLYTNFGEHHITAYDLNAACSGYIYALNHAKDFLKSRPKAQVLLLTAEALSKYVDPTDFDTAFLFGDAATATIITGEEHIGDATAIVEQTLLTATAKPAEVINVPTNKASGIALKGGMLFTSAVKTMSQVMHDCCENAKLDLHDFDLIVPHQANLRISAAIEKRLKLAPGTLYSNIERFGNTSSCTIPIALSETLNDLKANEKVALCAFGAGFTAGAAILTKK